MKNILTAFLLIAATATFAQQKNFLDKPYIETTAIVDTLVTPDRIYMTIVLSESDTKGKKSTEELERLMQQKLHALNINIQKDLTLLDAGSDYKKYFLRSQDIHKSKIYSLLIRDAVTVGKVAIALESAGISNVNLSRIEYSKSKELLLKLKSLAVAKAKEQADYLTAPVGQKVGKAIFISDNSTSFISTLQGQIPGLNIRAASGAPGSSAEVLNVDFEKIKFESKVDVKFELQ